MPEEWILLIQQSDQKRLERLIERQLKYQDDLVRTGKFPWLPEGPERDRALRKARRELFSQGGRGCRAI